MSSETLLTCDVASVNVITLKPLTHPEVLKTICRDAVRMNSSTTLLYKRADFYSYQNTTRSCDFFDCGSITHGEDDPCWIHRVDSDWAEVHTSDLVVGTFCFVVEDGQAGICGVDMQARDVIRLVNCTL